MIKMTPETTKEIEKIIAKGDTAEVKKENNQIVVVGIERKVKIKTPITG